MVKYLKSRTFKALTLIASLAMIVGCNSKKSDLENDSEQTSDASTLTIEEMDFSKEPENVIYLAVGSFWHTSSVALF